MTGQYFKKLISLFLNTKFKLKTRDALQNYEIFYWWTRTMSVEFTKKISFPGQAMQCVDTGSQVCNLAWSKHASELVSTHGYSQNQVRLYCSCTEWYLLLPAKRPSLLSNHHKHSFTKQPLACLCSYGKILEATFCVKVVQFFTTFLIHQ